MFDGSCGNRDGTYAEAAVKENQVLPRKAFCEHTGCSHPVIWLIGSLSVFLLEAMCAGTSAFNLADLFGVDVFSPLSLFALCKKVTNSERFIGGKRREMLPENLIPGTMS